MIDQRAATLERQLDAERSSGTANTGTGTGTGTGSGGGSGQMAVQFFEKRRRKAWLSRGDDEVCWECWTVKVTVAEPRTESGAFPSHPQIHFKHVICRKQCLLGGWGADVSGMLTTSRARKGPSCHGTDPAYHSHEDSDLCQYAQRSHTPHHNNSCQSIPVQNSYRAKGYWLGLSYSHLLGLTRGPFRHLASCSFFLPASCSVAH